MFIADPELPDCPVFSDILPWIVGGFLATVALTALVGLASAWIDARNERKRVETVETEIEEDGE